MNCQTAESMVNRYIEHDLSVDELEDFLEHVENCPSCYDELKLILLFMLPCSSWMRRAEIPHWIFGSFWKKIFVNPSIIY